MKNLILTLSTFLMLGGISYAQPTFQPAQTNPFGLSSNGGLSSCKAVDMDNDGDLDIMSSAGGNFYYFENIGNASSPSYAAAVMNPFGLTTYGGIHYPDVVDLDGDGDLDIYVSSRYYENTGSASSPSFAAAVINAFNLNSPGSVSYAAFADIDGDGDLDFLSMTNSYQYIYQENTGTANAPAFANALNSFFGLSQAIGSDPHRFYSNPKFWDYDNDGDYDLFYGRDLSNTMALIENEGTANSASFNPANIVINPFGLSNPSSDANMAFADYDNNSTIDVIYGSRGGNFYFQENTTPPPPPVPTMGEWALIIFGLIILNLGVVSVMNWERRKRVQLA